MKLRWMRRWCRWSVLAVLGAGSTGLGFAVEPPEGANRNGLTLDEAVRLALANNPALRASGDRVEAATGRAHQARKWTNPELQLNADEWPVSGGRGFSDAIQTVGIAQTLPYPGKKSLDTRIGSAGVALSQAELALRRTEMVRDVKASFFRVLASERFIEVSAARVSSAEASAAMARKRVDAGAAAFQEQLRAEIQLEQARTELVAFQLGRATARQVLASLTGQPDVASAVLSGVLAERADPALLDAVPDGLMARHPSAAAAQANLDRALLEHRRARLEPYPDVKLGVSGGRMGETDQSIIQLGFSLPLPVLDRGKGRQQETHANANAAEAELRSIQQQLQREWANARERYRAAVAQVANYQERMLPRADEALRLVQTGFEEGKFPFIDLVDTQRTATEVRLAYQQKLLEMSVAQAELEALLHPQTIQPFSPK